MIGRPTPDESPAYYHRYFSLVNESELIDAMENSLKYSLSLFASIGKEKENFRYAADKWTVKEVLCHIVDCERVYAYRALRFSRKDSTPLPGFDENAYAPSANAAGRSLSQIVDEYTAVRHASMELFRYMTDQMLDFKGTANKTVVTPRAIGWMIPGHNNHHCNILRDRYL